MLQNIIDSNNSVREALEKGLDAVKLQENWDYLQINCAMYINSDMPGVASQSQPNTKPLRQAQVLTITLAFSVCAFFAGLLRSDQRHRRCHIFVCLLPPCSVASAQSTFKTLSIENLSLRNADITRANSRAYLGRCLYRDSVILPIKAGPLQGLCLQCILGDCGA